MRCRLSLVATTVFAVTCLAMPARADETTPATTTLPTITIVGRPARPNITVVLTRPTAAREAGAAHEAVRKALVEASVPATLRKP